jgi:hypothetical protein
MSRTIYIKSEGNARPKKVTDFQGLTFGELKAHVTDVNFDNANVIIHSTKTTLFDDTSMIPAEGDVILLVVPKQMKAGSADYSNYKRNDILSDVRTIIDTDGDAARQYFGNYPQMKTPALVALLQNYGAEAAEASVNESSIADSPEYQRLVAVHQRLSSAVSELNDAVSDIGQLINQEPEETFGGVTESQLDKVFEELKAVRL